jgi:ABC-type tungstate transport system permease subunit
MPVRTEHRNLAREREEAGMAEKLSEAEETTYRQWHSRQPSSGDRNREARIWATLDAEREVNDALFRVNEGVIADLETAEAEVAALKAERDRYKGALLRGDCATVVVGRAALASESEES